MKRQEAEFVAIKEKARNYMLEQHRENQKLREQNEKLMKDMKEMEATQ